MKYLYWLVLLVSLRYTGNATAQSGITEQNGRNLTCASDDMGKHYCEVNTNGGVRMVNQRSGSPCVQGQTWGWDRRGIWVDRGCRADFVVGRGGPGNNNGGPGNGWGNGNGNGWGNGNGGQQITCSSNDGRRNYCNADTSGGVRMVNQRSGSPCIQGQTWGWDRNRIWVDRGCRADFVTGRDNGGPGNGWGNGNGGGRPGLGVQVITCSSNDGRRNYCSIPPNARVELSRQISGSPCRDGDTWGTDRRGLWVDRGCRAEFRIR
ncbi:DUF3011 domain-containing protein [Terriglobus tenax]|uniref:DUF3011 domain-containing protein n=1 Tax=Terriglobus tenax TaxID=1111115 RepID=UPI0021DFD656|nr:DUF3011 domain-containing protein [Terriglobus tenax]